MSRPEYGIVNISKEIHEELRVYAFNRRENMKSVAEKALKHFFRTFKKSVRQEFLKDRNWVSFDSEDYETIWNWRYPETDFEDVVGTNTLGDYLKEIEAAEDVYFGTLSNGETVLIDKGFLKKFEKQHKFIGDCSFEELEEIEPLIK